MADLTVVQGTARTITFTLTNDGVPVDSEAAVTLTLTRADGTVLETDAATTHGAADSGEYSFQLVPLFHTDVLDVLTAAWTFTLDSVPQTTTDTVEVAGGVYFTLAQVRADEDFEDPLVYSTATIFDARSYAEQEIERKAYVSYVPRYSLETFVGRGGGTLSTGRLMLRSVRTATIDGVTIDPTALTVNGNTGVLTNLAGWTRGTVIELGLEHGLDQPPRAIGNAALIVAKDYLAHGPVADRMVQQQTDLGPIWIPQPGWKGNRFGLPEVDAAIEAHGFANVLVA